MSRREHIYRLAEPLGVGVKLTPNPRILSDGRIVPAGYADGRARTIGVQGWDDGQLAYFAGLHELGHHARHFGRRGFDPDRDYWGRIVEAEAEAWDWALENTAEAPTVLTRRTIARDWLGSYVRDRTWSPAAKIPGPAFERVSTTLGLTPR